MASKKSPTLFIYLARRDKKGVKVITTLMGECRPLRLNNIDLLRLPREWKLFITSIIHKNRMYWEPWIESASSFKQLKQKLRSRGYRNLPMSGEPIRLLSSIPTKMIDPKDHPGLYNPHIDPRVLKNLEHQSKKRINGDQRDKN